MVRSQPPSLTAKPDPPDGAPGRWVGVGFCVLSAAGFSSLGILAKLAYGQGLGIFPILAIRFAGGAALLGGILLFTQRRSLFPARRRILVWFALGAVGYAVQAGLYFSALRRIPASVASLLLYLHPVLVGLLAWAFNRKPPLRREWLAMALALGGVALTVSPAGSGIPAARPALDGLGVAFVLGSAVWYAGYILLTERALRGSGTLVPTAWILLGGSTTFCMITWLRGEWRLDLTPSQTAILLAMIFFSTIIPISAFLAGLKRVGPTTASLLSTLEPVFTVLLAFVFLAESLSTRQATGGALVLAAVVALNLPGGRSVP